MRANRSRFGYLRPYYRPLVMEERKSLGTAERIRLTDEILLDALFTGLGDNRTSSHVEQGNIAIHRYRRKNREPCFMLCVLALPADDARPRRRSPEEKKELPAAAGSFQLPAVPDARARLWA